MAYSVVPKTKRDGVIKLKDGAATAVELEVAFEDGNFSFSQPNQYSEQRIVTGKQSKPF